MRKIVQITAVPSAMFGYLYALCDDGTLWMKSVGGPGNWSLVEEVPQGQVQN